MWWYYNFSSSTCFIFFKFWFNFSHLWCLWQINGSLIWATKKKSDMNCFSFLLDRGEIFMSLTFWIQILGLKEQFWSLKIFYERGGSLYSVQQYYHSNLITFFAKNAKNVLGTRYTSDSICKCVTAMHPIQYIELSASSNSCHCQWNSYERIFNQKFYLIFMYIFLPFLLTTISKSKMPKTFLQMHDNVPSAW